MEKKPEKAVKPNKGQDEVLHIFTAPDGTEVTGTQREWRETYRDAGYTRTDEDEEATPEEPAEE